MATLRSERSLLMSKNGFLTPTRREYLRGEHEPPSKNAEETMRSAIRETTQEVLEDLALVSRGLSKKDRKLIAQGTNVPFEAGPLEYANFSPSRGGRISSLGVDPVRSENQIHQSSDKMDPEFQSFVLDTFTLLLSLCEHGHVHPLRANESALMDYYNRVSLLDHIAHVKVRPENGEAQTGREKLSRGENLKPTEVKALLAKGFEFPEPE